MESNRRKIKTSWVITVVFIAILLLLTFFSKTLYNMNLPVVNVTTPTYGSLIHVYSDTTLVRAKNTYTLYASSGLKIKDVYMEQGDTVKQGETIMTFDVSGLENELKDLESLREQKILEKKSTRGNYAKMINLSIEDVERDIQVKRDEIEASSALVAPNDGVIVDMKANPGMATGTEPVVIMDESSAGFEVVINMPVEEAVWFSPGDMIDIKIPSIQTMLQGRIIRINTADNGNQDVHADLIDPPEEAAGGQLATVKCVSTTDHYETIVPISAIYSEGDRDYIFKVQQSAGTLGEEYRLYKTYVRVLDEDNDHAAIESALAINQDMVVVGSDKELVGGRVILNRGQGEPK